VHHDVLLFLLGLAVLLGLARILGEIARRFGFPAVVGEIIAGIALGKTLLGRVAPNAFTWLFADPSAKIMLSGYSTVAVMLLLVVAGLEIDLTVVKKSGRVVIVTSLLGIVMPFVLGYGLGLVLPDTDLADPSRRGLHAAFLGIALSISALPVIAKTLLDLGLMKTELGLVILSSAVVDDLIGWTSFSVLSQQFDTHGHGSIGLSVLLTLGFVVVTLTVVRPFADWMLTKLSGHDEAQTGRVLSVVMVLALLGAVATQALGMHPVFGGFVMGIAVGDSPRLREHTRQILHDFVSYVFTPVFFATMALRYDFAAGFDARLVLIVILIACVAKVAGCAVGARVAGVAWREATAIGFGKNSRGAMEILLAVLALEAKIINEKLFVALVVMAVFTSLISGPALVRILRPATSPIVALLRAGEIAIDLDVAGREALIEKLTAALAARLGRPEDAARFAASVLAREDLAGTGVGEGVAFPHAEIDGLDKPVLAFARLRDGIDFDAPDGEKARLVFLLLFPSKEYDDELQILSAMARLLSRAEVRRGLLDAKSARDVIGLLDEAGRTPVPMGPQAAPNPAPAKPAQMTARGARS
jgi:Kef-type K+ transport system membrane component KefB